MCWAVCSRRLPGRRWRRSARRVNAIADSRTLPVRGIEQRCLSQVHEHVLSGDSHVRGGPPQSQHHSLSPRDCARTGSRSLDWFRINSADEMVRGEGEIVGPRSSRCELRGFGPPRRRACRFELSSVDGMLQAAHLVDATANVLTRVEVFEEYTTYPGEFRFPPSATGQHRWMGPSVRCI